MNKIKILFSSERKKKAVILCAFILGAALLVASFNSDDKGKNTETSALYSEREYSAFLEQKLKSTLESVLGEDMCEVMITLEKKIEEHAVNKNKNENLFTFSSEKTESDISDNTYYEIRGVMIVCKGAQNTRDFETIKRASSTALGTEQSKIYIIGGASTQ